MKGPAFRVAIDQLNLSQVGAAKFLGISGRQARRIAAGEAPLGLAGEKLLRLMIRLDLTPAQVNSGMVPSGKPPRRP